MVFHFKSYKLLLVFLCSLAVAACTKKNIDSSFSLWGDALKIELSVSPARHPPFESQGSENYYFVYGSIKISGQKVDVNNFSISCLGLNVAGQKSNEIYIDSLSLSGLTENLPAENNVIEAKVYWTFLNGVKPNVGDGIKLEELRSMDSCINAGTKLSRPHGS